MGLATMSKIKLEFENNNGEILAGLHERVHAEDCINCNDKIERITRTISLKGDLSDEQKQRLLAIADRCPVHSTLESDPKIVTQPG
jgi:putative redox protein